MPGLRRGNNDDFHDFFHHSFHLKMGGEVLRGQITSSKCSSVQPTVYNSKMLCDQTIMQQFYTSEKPEPANVSQWLFLHVSFKRNQQKWRCLYYKDSVKYIKFCATRRKWEAMLDLAESKTRIKTIWQNCALNTACRLRADRRGQERLQVELGKMRRVQQV